MVAIGCRNDIPLLILASKPKHLIIHVLVVFIKIIEHKIYFPKPKYMYTEMKFEVNTMLWYLCLL